MKDKFITQMHNLFNTRPNYRICLGITADFAFAKAEAEARVGTKDPTNQINPKYITLDNTKEIEELHYDGGWDDEKKINKAKETYKQYTEKRPINLRMQKICTC